MLIVCRGCMRCSRLSLRLSAVFVCGVWFCGRKFAFRDLWLLLHIYLCVDDRDEFLWLGLVSVIGWGVLPDWLLVADFGCHMVPRSSGLCDFHKTLAFASNSEGSIVDRERFLSSFCKNFIACF